MSTTPLDRTLFVDYQVPSLAAGDYSIKVTQTIGVDPKAYTATRTFSVAGERFALPPELVGAVFPPDGSIGDHSHVLPHLVLSRSSLPWERAPQAARGQGAPLPWLALLLFAGDEQPEPQVMPLSAATGTADAYFPAPAALPAGDDPKVTVIDVPRALLADLLPTRAELPLLAHIRRGDGDVPDGAVVVGKRLPPAGTSSTVHLVSLEGRFPAGGDFDLGPGGPDSLVRLVSLADWRFACLDEAETFGRLVAGLTDSGSPLRLPDSGEQHADTFLRQGYVPVRHRLRGGGRSVAWYRGPFAIGPATSADPDQGPARAADELLRYHPGVGMFDVSHAAAWEAGRLLALRSTGFAGALYEWKRRRDQAEKRTVAAAHPLAVAQIDDALPAGVTEWLTGLCRLDGVPFGYLVPDERLLPVETVRFFHLDQEWMRHLVDGAYSLGRVGTADAELDAAHPLPLDYPLVTGALIRSDVVSGYPGLLVEGYADPAGARLLTPVRVERLAPSVLLCLYRGDLGRLDIHQQPESLHFGVEPQPGGSFTKRLRGLADTAPDAGELAPLPLGPRGTVPVRQLADAMAARLGADPAAFTAGALARQMTETGERVTFLRG
ncbi:hypothetical protein OG762_39350 [Streptomyces sp. NBC_01136]|uniref:hypothetical protein n=1 Tax=Streptomyces sp. NBC_01136 TaxID=2903754 RepID=UPI0038639DC1|nr:hypothetical protein OG762_39350 [Streptomyces sp. NBC_01136]